MEPSKIHEPLALYVYIYIMYICIYVYMYYIYIHIHINIYIHIHRNITFYIQVYTDNIYIYHAHENQEFSTTDIAGRVRSPDEDPTVFESQFDFSVRGPCGPCGPCAEPRGGLRYELFTDTVRQLLIYGNIWDEIWELGLPSGKLT